MAGDSAGGKEVGRISIRVVPDLKDFRSKLAAELKAIEDSMKATIKVEVDLDADGAKAHMRALLAELKAMAAKDVKVNVDVDGDTFQREASKIASSATGAVGGLGGMSHGLLIVAAVAAFAAPALALISGVLISLPAILAAVLVPIAAMALGMDGLKKAAEVLKPGFDALKATMNGATQSQFTPVFEKLNAIFPTLSANLPKVTQGIADMAQGFVTSVTSAAGMEKIKNIISRIGELFTNLSPSVSKVTDGLLGLASSVSDHFPGLAKFIDDIATRFTNWVSKISKKDWFGNSPLDRAMGSLKESLQGIVDLVAKLGEKGFDFLSDPNMGKSIKDFFDSAKSFVETTLPALGSFFKDLATDLKTATDALEKLRGAGDFLGADKRAEAKKDPNKQGNLAKFGLTEDANIVIWFNKFKQANTDLWSDFGLKANAAIANASTILGTAWGGLVNIAQTIWTEISTRVQVQISIIIAKVQAIPGAIAGVWDAVKVAANTAWITVTTNAQVQFAILVQTIRQKGGEIVAEIASWPGKVVGALAGLAGQLLTAGSNAGAALATGLRSQLGNVINAAKSLADGSSIAAKGALKIKSPSRVFTEIGENTGQGFINGLDASQEKIVATARAIFQAMKDVFGEKLPNITLDLGGAGGGSGGFPAQIQDITSATKDFQKTVGDGIKPGQISADTKGQIELLKQQQASLEIQAKQATIDAKGAGSKAEKEKLQALAAQLRLQKDQLGLQADQLGFADKYSDSVQGTNSAFDDASKKLGQVPMDFAKATGQQAMSDLGISGNGAIPQGLTAGLDWLTKLGSTTINVNSLDEGLAAKQNLTNKKAMQYTQR